MISQRPMILESLIIEIATNGKPHKNVSYLQAKGFTYKSKSMICGIKNNPVVVNL